ncbi:MAG: D-alanyl-D-alanine carboxypeptidase family protein [Ruminococcus sp.]|nr:D-alanyl-D-alanine carboxypeptidase family protein [Ruminococcus sp.]
MVNRHIRTDRVVVCILILIIVSIFPADFTKRFIDRHSDGYNTDNAVVIRFNGSIYDDTASSNIVDPDIDDGQAGFTEINVESSQLVSGTLVMVNNDTPYVSLEMTAVVDLLNYRNDYYTLINETDSVILNAEAADALNMMMKDYYDSTGLTNFLVYGTTNTYTGNDSYCPQYFPESATANTIDLAVNVGDSVMSYDGCDNEKWIIENCHKYGYILRFPAGKTEKTATGFYPWHLRYVGKVHAAVMNELNYCFEEYLDFLKNYTFDHPLSYNLKGNMYCIYSVRYEGEITSVPVPLSGNYTISGNNTDSFIVTSVKF